MPVEQAMKGGLFRKVEPRSLRTEGALTDRAEQLGQWSTED